MFSTLAFSYVRSQTGGAGHKEELNGRIHNDSSLSEPTLHMFSGLILEF